MTRKSDKQLVVGLDIGTSKVAAIVGEYGGDEPVEVIGFGSHVSRGLKRGAVVDIDSTVHSVQRAVEEAELMAGCEIRSVFVSISGSHLETENSHGTAPIRDREVTQQDVQQVLESARAVAIPADRKVIYYEPQEYRVDGQDGIRSPQGMSGVRLEAGVHLVTGAASAIQNISKCVNRCDLSVDALVPSAVASASAVLTNDERELGVCLVDIGAGTTDIAIYAQGAIRYTKALPVGGDQVTNDISHGIRTPTAHAEDIKIKYACALAQLARSDETVQVPSVGEREPRRMERQLLAQIVQARYEEIFEMVYDEVHKSGYESLLAAGVVLTGGGARMQGAVELAEEVFHKMVRLGKPQYVVGLDEVLTSQMQPTAVGLLLYGATNGSTLGLMQPGFEGRGKTSRVVEWFKRHF